MYLYLLVSLVVGIPATGAAPSIHSLAPYSYSRYDLVVASLKTDRRRPLEYTLLYVLYGFLIVT